jgi:tetratricopeptide (TPR) repeat protein
LNQLKLQILYALKDFSAIEKHYIFLIKKSPEKLTFSYRLADYYYQQKEGKKSVAVLEAAIKNNPEILAPKLALLKVLTLQDLTKAEVKVKEYLVQTPKEAELYFSLAKLYNAQNKPEQAIEQLKLLIKNSENEQAKLNAKVLLATNEKDPDLSASLVAEILAADEHHLGGLLLQSKSKLLKGEYDDAIVDLRALLRDYPKSDQAMVFLAEAYSKINSPELANDNFRQALKINPSNEFAITAVVATMIKDKNFMGAENVIERSLKRNPNSITALLKLAEIRFLQQNWQGADEVVALIAAQPKGIAWSKYVSGRILQGQKRYAEAIVNYKEAIKHSPNLFSAIESMMVAYEALKQRPIMHRYLADYVKTHPNQPNAVSLQAQLYMLDKNWDKELSLLMTANQKWPKISALYQRISAIFRMKKEDEKAIATYKKGIENLPTDIYLTMNLASIYETRENYQAAITLYETFLVKKPKNNIAINNLASLLVDRFPTPENLKRALALTEAFSDSKYLHLFDTYGWVLLANNKNDEALKIFKNVVGKAPKIAVFKYHLAKAYAKTGNASEAILELEDALKIAEKGGEFADKAQALALLKELKV